MKKMVVTALLIIVFSAAHSWATAQYPDKIIFEGKEYALNTNPLETYFKQYPEKRPETGIRSTALWRGYVATFEVKDKTLLVKDIAIEINSAPGSKNLDLAWKSVLNDVFPGGKALAVDWFSGILVLPHGELVNYVHMGYGSTYSNYILLEVKDGIVTGEKRMNARQYETFK